MANEVDEFLKDVKGSEKGEPFVKDDSDPLEDNKVGTESVKDDEVKDKSEEDADEKVPFHKNPKLQRYIEKEIGKRIKDIQPSAKETFVKDVGAEADELTETLIEIIGNDTPQKVAAVKKFRSQLEGLKESGAERALAQLREQAEAETQAEAEAVEEISNAFDAIEEEYGVDLTSNTVQAKKERNDFIDFVKRVSPKDSNGDVVQYPDFDETWKLFQSTRKPAENKRAKDLAARGVARSTDASAAPTTGKSWKDVDRIFSKINN